MQNSRENEEFLHILRKTAAKDGKFCYGGERKQGTYPSRANGETQIKPSFPPLPNPKQKLHLEAINLTQKRRRNVV